MSRGRFTLTEPSDTRKELETLHTKSLFSIGDDRSENAKFLKTDATGHRRCVRLRT
jgi:hypothetical protein